MLHLTAMLNPPFKLNSTPLTCCEDHALTSDTGVIQASATIGRCRLADLDPHLHCSIIGTCISTAELRKLMARFLEVKGASDLDIHHGTVTLTAENSEVARVLNKALDQRHAATLRVFALAANDQDLGLAWDKAMRQGEIPGAYWALMTHKRVTPELRQRAFGDVHMLSHLVGSANGANIRRLVDMERINAELQARLEREQVRRQELVTERDALSEQLQAVLSGEAARRLETVAQASRPSPQDASSHHELVALHTERRAHAEQLAATAEAEAQQLRHEIDRIRKHAIALSQELSAAESELRVLGAGAAADTSPLAEVLKDRRILYVGGRPSSTPAIRALVERHGGQFLHHDGGLETRKGLLPASIPNADLVVFPVDCVDHDSVLNLKRVAERHKVPFLPLRSASVAGFAAALSQGLHTVDAERALLPTAPFCRKHA